MPFECYNKRTRKLFRDLAVFLSEMEFSGEEPCYGLD